MGRGNIEQKREVGAVSDSLAKFQFVTTPQLFANYVTFGPKKAARHVLPRHNVILRLTATRETVA